MNIIRVTKNEFGDLRRLHANYKLEIGEAAPTDADFASLLRAIEAGVILFYACEDGGALVACCSVSPTFSTFNYSRAGVFEDFYILPEYRHKGVARRLVEFAFAQSGVGSLIVGCADCDVELYKALGFRVPLGNMLAYDAPAH